MIFTPLALLFIVFAISRVILRYNDELMSFKELLFWGTFWIMAFVVIASPSISDKAARIIGIQRGVDAIIYISIIAIFYLVFRLYIKVSEVEREITRLVRAIAIKEASEHHK